MNNYYQILGVTSNATSAQIKKAFRAKAKLLHPDVNKAENAHEAFVLLTEAYEFLINTAGTYTNTAKQKQQQAQRRAAYKKEWEQKEREKARAKAQEYARMKYEAYIKSDVYKTTEAINVVVDFIGLIFILFLIIGLPVFTYIEHGNIALIISGIVLLPTSPLWFRFIVRTLSTGKLRSFYIKKEATLKSKTITFVVLFILNGVLFFNVVLNTLVNIYVILGLYLFTFTIALFLSKRYKSHFTRVYYKFLLAPGIVNLFFCINYWVSFNQHEQQHWYTYKMGSPVFKEIVIDNNKFDQYIGMRFFLIDEELKDGSQINFTLADGLFGLKTVHNVEFNSTH
ncbi:J domain-containing protein [Saccharicrinis aurantiacus]|uniref:J domain-containing protein n=1 Tax=Saccharicrinis aurantiacus TaxID=1849719 RepID=UPI002493A71A|nr:J domain-containing protein [Saccharicrinis aurantiacus]